MVTFLDILEARNSSPERVHELAARRVLEVAGKGSLAVVPHETALWDEFRRRGYNPLGLSAKIVTLDGGPGRVSLECLCGRSLREVGRLGTRFHRRVLFSGPETGGDICILLPEGGLQRCGPRDVPGLTRGCEALCGARSLRLNNRPWGWIEAVPEDAWARAQGVAGGGS